MPDLFVSQGDTQEDCTAHSTQGGVVLAVYAPFGADKALSAFPDGVSRDLIQHPLAQNLIRVAAHKVHVVALIDRAESDTYLLQARAGQMASVQLTSLWKQDMASPNTLAGFLRYVHDRHPGAAIVLAMEGGGVGFLPELDRSQINLQALTNHGRYGWNVNLDSGAPVFPNGEPVVKAGAPTLPVALPMPPAPSMVLSTYDLGRALRDATDAGVPKLAVIHLNNCFSLSIEVLHTIAPYAEYAVGYPSYNLFTAGALYPRVFEQLQAAGSASSAQLAEWLALGNCDMPPAKGSQHTAGGVVKLAAVHQIVEKIDDLADGLLAALRNSLNRSQVVMNIREAIIQAQQADTAHGDSSLDALYERTDVCGFAQALKRFDFGAFNSVVHDAADALLAATAGVQAHGERAINIFLPDPLLRGLWDWRSLFYLDVNPDPAKPRVQPNIIEFVKITDWVDFILEYHKDVPFIGLLPAAIPEIPLLNPAS